MIFYDYLIYLQNYKFKKFFALSRLIVLARLPCIHSADDIEWYQSAREREQERKREREREEILLATGLYADYVVDVILAQNDDTHRAEGEQRLICVLAAHGRCMMSMMILRRRLYRWLAVTSDL